MSKLRWIGNAPVVQQVNTLTPASVGIGNIFTVTINGKSVTYTAAAATVADVCNNMTTLLAASQIAEFKEIAWTTTGSVILATGTTIGIGGSGGVPFTQTSGASGGSATFTTVATTAASGPNWWNVGPNWSTGSVPASGDDVFLDSSSVSILYGINNAGVTLDSLSQSMSYTGIVGLPKTNANGYPEYRLDFCQIGATTVTLGTGSGQGSSQLKFDFGTVATAVSTYGSGRSSVQGLEAILLKGTNIANTFAISGSTSSVAIAGYLIETSSVAALSVTGGAVRCGPGVTFESGAVVTNYNGTLAINSAVPGTIENSGGNLTIYGSGAIATLDVSGGTCDEQGTGTITQVNVGPGQLSCLNNASPRTFTGTLLRPGGQINDPAKSITYANGVTRSAAVNTLQAA